ncbi:MAG: efflux RND transporter periplasmic adaptor subunit [Magnetococcales bacterium]|nr:efflux RND transporter periplasmic adaptor subunit [Magnetococcales bacterium]
MKRPWSLLLALLCWLPPAGIPVAMAGETPQVTTRPVGQLLIHPREEAPAETLALQDGLLTAQVTGNVLELPAQVGDAVRAGAPLVRLDPWAYRLAARRAAAELEALRAQRDDALKQTQRLERLQRANHASEETLERKQAEVRTLDARIHGAEAALEEARTQTEKCLITAPFAGVVVQRPARLGMTATPGAPLLQLVDVDDLELSARIDARRVDRLGRAAGVTFLHAGKRYPVTPRAVVPHADPVSRTLEARLRFDKEKPAPGSTGRLLWEDPQPHLPPWTFVTRDNETGVFLLRQGKAHFHRIPGAMEGHPAPADDLDPAEEVILDGREGLTHDARVRTTP